MDKTQKNRLKHLISKAEKQYYTANVRLTMLKDTLYNLRKEISQIVTDNEEWEGK